MSVKVVAQRVKILEKDTVEGFVSIINVSIFTAFDLISSYSGSN